MCLLTSASNYLNIFFIIFIFITNSLISNSETVKEATDYCKFELANGKIDLSPLSILLPLFVSTPASLYIYHPCADSVLPLPQVNECSKGYGLCYFTPKTPTDKPVDFDKFIKNEIQGNYTLLAHNAEGVFRETLTHKPEIVFKHAKNESAIITTTVQLECDENIENYKLAILKTSPLEHVLTLSTRYACVHIPHHMSGGTVFFIILVVFVGLYFIGGVLVLKFIRGATGVEMVPNHEFWCSLPQRAKDGFNYLRGCGKNTPDSYEKI